MKIISFGALALLVSTGLQAAQLHVQAGKTLTLDDKQNTLTLDELVLEDNATLIIPSSLSRVQIDARKAVFGDHTRILAQGKEGAAGQPGAGQTGQAESCEDGANGGNGEHGSNGGDGVELGLTLQIAALGGLEIDTRGGAGGIGGTGGTGQSGGSFDSCNAPAGGDGGRGGDGGDGGNGGHVRVLYTLLPASGLKAVGDRIQVNAGGGKGASGGAGGKGGEGVQGHFINKKTLTGNKKWEAGGKAGSDGIVGKAGRDGSKGQVVVQQDLRSRMDELVQTQAAKVEANTEQTLTGVNQQIDALKQTVSGLATKELVQQQAQELDAISKRLDRLEAQLDKLTGLLNQKKQTPPKSP